MPLEMAKIIYYASTHRLHHSQSQVATNREMLSSFFSEENFSLFSSCISYTGHNECLNVLNAMSGGPEHFSAEAMFPFNQGVL
jgi:hypothetical protein